MDVLTAIRTKRAVRQFTDEPIPDHVLDKILKAALKAQSSKNSQPWQLIVIRDRATMVELSKLGDFLSHVADATVCVVYASPDDNPWTFFDLGQSAAYLQLEAHELGVGSCLGAIYQPPAAKNLLGVPDELSVNALVSLGYPAPAHKPAALGGRKSVGEAVHWDHW